MPPQDLRVRYEADIIGSLGTSEAYFGFTAVHG